MKKNVLILGAMGILGRKITEAFREENLILCDIREDTEYAGDFSYRKCDVCREKDVEDVAKYLEETNMGIDVLIYTAGIYERGKVEELSIEQWRKSLDINVTGLFIVLRGLIRYMKPDGKIIAVASQFGQVGVYESAAYCASKAAMINLIRSVALDYGAKKIQANCVCPGFFESGFLSDIEKNVHMKREWMAVLSMLPKSKIKADEVVAVIQMLSSNSGITGQCITVDGGYTAR